MMNTMWRFLRRLFVRHRWVNHSAELRECRICGMAEAYDSEIDLLAKGLWITIKHGSVDMHFRRQSEAAFIAESNELRKRHYKGKSTALRNAELAMSSPWIADKQKTLDSYTSGQLLNTSNDLPAAYGRPGEIKQPSQASLDRSPQPGCHRPRLGSCREIEF